MAKPKPKQESAVFEVCLKLASSKPDVRPKRIRLPSDTAEEAIAKARRFAIASEQVISVQQMLPDMGPVVPVPPLTMEV